MPGPPSRTRTARSTSSTSTFSAATSASASPLPIERLDLTVAANQKCHYWEHRSLCSGELLLHQHCNRRQSSSSIDIAIADSGRRHQNEMSWLSGVAAGTGIEHARSRIASPVPKSSITAVWSETRCQDRAHGHQKRAHSARSRCRRPPQRASTAWRRCARRGCCKEGPHLPGDDAAGRESVVAVGTWECVIFFFSFAHRDLIF